MVFPLFPVEYDSDRVGFTTRSESYSTKSIIDLDMEILLIRFFTDAQDCLIRPRRHPFPGSEIVRLTFHGGVAEIGGNKILLEDRDARLWLDIKQAGALRASYSEGWRRGGGIGA